jgi:hypothetical protein
LPGRRPPTLSTSVGRWLPDAFPSLLVSVLSAALSGGDGGSAAAPVGEASVARSRLPRDPAKSVVALTIRGGDARWMPPRWADRPVLHVTQEAAYVERAARPRVVLDLDRIRLVSLARDEEADHAEAGFVGAVLDHVPGTLPVASGARIRHPDDECAAVVETPQGTFTAVGPWVAVAWLGLVARWPDPGLPGLPGLPGQ